MLQCNADCVFNTNGRCMYSSPRLRGTETSDETGQLLKCESFRWASDQAEESYGD
jgi:hypothetical protein